ncbi:PAS-domain containing protein [uncultured Paraglaciecola sp.]|uniref:PAS domain-containing hybrid sensor histidine kinase/response regulator n=1 Tax=uncultured Paraglaciecola sp. TaxID=1765024 RepID=UPI0025ED340B|nr:PAS-domain containing protein [uncultured Paraglaciecola sp.]
MGLGWVALAIAYLACLFWLARWGDSHSVSAKKLTSHPAIYSLALAIYCTAWTFFGSVGEATRNTWSYLPILLGPTLLYLFGYRFLLKLTQVSKKQHITTIADFISSRYGKRQTVALLVTIIALLATIPYIALQLKAIGSAFFLVSGQKDAGNVVLGATLFIALFSIYFGTQRTDVTEYRRGLILAISFESIIKLTALICVAFYGYYWWQQQSSEPMLLSFVSYEVLDNFQSTSFWAQTLMAAAAVICLPRQFHVAVIDNLSLSHIKTARWLFPLYLGLMAAVIPIIAVAGQAMLGGSGNEPDTYVLGLAIMSESLALKMLVFLGGLSAATAMIVVATLTLSTMLTNDVILPKFLATRSHQQHSPDYTRTILMIRRIVIGVLLLLAYLYQQQMTNSRSLASIGLIAFSLVIQLLPAIVGGLYWKRGHAHGVYAGLIVGVSVWVLWLILPIINESSGIILHNNAISEGAILSLIANTMAYVLFSMFAQTRLIDRIQAEAFVTSIETRGEHYDKHPLSTTVGDLITLLSTFLGESRCQMLIKEYQKRQGIILSFDQRPHKNFVVFSERALGGVIGASSAKVLVDSALSGKRLNFEEVVNFFDDTTQAIQFNISALFTSLESLEQGISVIDRNLDLVAWNKSYVALFDYPDDLITVGTPIEILVRYNAERGECGVGNVDTLVQKRLEHMRCGTSHRFLRQRSDGRVIEMVGNPLPGGGFVTSFNDVTQHIEIQHALKEANIDLENRIQKRSEEVQTINAELHLEIERRADAEKELVSARKNAEVANANKTHFLALASHDILQPLNAAKLYLSALQEVSLEKDASQIVQKLGESLNASEALIATLLDIARLDQGDMKPRYSAVSIKALVSPLIDELSMNAEEKGLQLKYRLQDLWLKTDRTYLYRILQNLLSNAIKYTPTGKVLLSVRKRRDKVLLQVWDTGTGIHQEELNNIFGDFYRSGDHSQQGFGLGLGVVARLSKQLNALVEVRSILGRGSCFSIELPSCAAVEPVSIKKASGNKVGLAGLRVLCVDDKQENLDAMLTFLDKWQVNVTTALTSDEAMAALKVSEPQVILMDYHLDKGENGLQLVAKIRKFLGYPIPVILVTANQDDEIITEAFKANCNYLSKPVKPAKLRSLLQAVQVEGAKQ